MPLGDIDQFITGNPQLSTMGRRLMEDLTAVSIATESVMCNAGAAPLREGHSSDLLGVACTDGRLSKG